MKTDTILENLRQVLPCVTCAEMTAKLQDRGLEVEEQNVASAIAILRKNSGHYGWTIPHVKRGRPDLGEEQRFFAVRVDRAGRYLNQSNREDQKNGLISTAHQMITEMGNCATALEAAAQNVNSAAAAQMARDLAADFYDLRRRTVRTLRAIEQADGTNGNGA